jgi:PhnB protein
MNQLFNTYRPEGFGTIAPYLMVEKPEELIQFLKDAFYAEVLDSSIDDKTGSLSNCILRIGESCFMISQAKGEFSGMKTSFYIYVNDVDTTHKRALDLGSKEVFGPQEMPYMDYQSGIIDPAGNYWWISKRMVNEPYS